MYTNCDVGHQMLKLKTYPVRENTAIIKDNALYTLVKHFTI